MSLREWWKLQPGDRVQGRLVLAVVVRDERTDFRLRSHTYVATVCTLAGCYNVIVAKAYDTFNGSVGICYPCTCARNFYGHKQVEEARQKLSRMKRAAYKPFVPTHALPKKPPGQ